MIFQFSFCFCLQQIITGAPELKGHRSEVKARLGQALQNKRKYQNDVKVGKRKKKNE